MSLDKTTSCERKSPLTDPEEGPSEHRKESPGSAGVILHLLSGCAPDRLAKSGDKAMFETKYRTEKQLGAGAYGTVSSGYRREDNLPVAMKYIMPVRVKYIDVPIDGEMRTIPLEVAMLCKASPAASKTSATVALLDWYDDKEYVILVMERPDPCCNLLTFVEAQRSPMSEEAAKSIAKQLVDAAIELHSRRVFHNDIKMDNILLELGSSVPRVRMIDLGYSKFILEKTCPAQQGTKVDPTPQLFTALEEEAELVTVSQIGSTLCDILMMYRSNFGHLSSDCIGFMRFQTNRTGARLTSLREHPWFV